MDWKDKDKEITLTFTGEELVSLYYLVDRSIDYDDKKDVKMLKKIEKEWKKLRS